MRALRMSLVAWLVLMASVLAPSTAAAVTVEQIVQLSRSGVTEAVILALIDRDKTIFALEPEQLVTLKAQGVSERVILAMLKSGREEGERAAQAAAELNAGFIMQSLPAAPEVVIVGHGPDVPNGGWSSRSLFGPSGDEYLAFPYLPYAPYAPYAVAAPYGGFGGRRRHLPPPVPPYAAPPPVRQFVPPFSQPFVSPFHEAPVARPVTMPDIRIYTPPIVK